MGERGWRKLPYPKFLEKVQAGLWCCGMKLWDGRCVFGFRGKVRGESDGRHGEVEAWATVSEDLTGVVDRAHEAGLEFRAGVRIGGGVVWKSFDVVEARPAYNPDGSFHHMRFGLRERDGDGDAVCGESGCGTADCEGGAGGFGADCA